MPNEITAKELLALIGEKIQTGNYTDSVHKIKLLTTHEVIGKILNTEF